MRPTRVGSRATASSSSGVTLLARDARIYSIMDRQRRELVEQHLRGEQNRRLLIWSLLNVEQFLIQSDLA